MWIKNLFKKVKTWIKNLFKKVKTWIIATLTAFLIMLGVIVPQADTRIGDFTFSWTAVGDDGLTGTATEYFLGWSYDRTEVESGIQTNVTEIPGLPTPQIAETFESFVVSLEFETGDSVYFGIWVADEAGNWSGVSNIKAVYIPDLEAPAEITDLDVTTTF